MAPTDCGFRDARAGYDARGKHTHSLRVLSSGQLSVNIDVNKRPGSVDATTLATRGWASHLAVFVTGVLVVEGLTGLWIFLAPFSTASQVQVLLHVVLGLIWIVPCLFYLVRHFLRWYRQTMTVVTVLGYALGVFTLVSIVTGVALTWQCAAGTRRLDTWAVIHQVSGLASLVLVGIHVPLAWTRRRKAARRAPALAVAARRFAWRCTGLVAGAIVLVAVSSVALRGEDPEFPVPSDYSLAEYLQKYDEYRGSPFAPTYARTESGKMVRPEVLGGSESCGTAGCHEQILEEWQPSAHRFSAMNRPFQQVQRNFADERGAHETRYCAGCHDPISLFAGAKDIHNQELSAPGMQEGCSCIACHTISKVDQRGNADYVLTPPQKYLWEGTSGVTKLLSDFLIRAYPRQHLADYDRNLLRTPEFCGVCHKQFIPEALNRFGMSPGQNQYDEWRNGHWHVEDVDKDLSCRDCHMRLVPNSTDPGRGEGGDVRRSADDGAHRHHGMIATNLFMPKSLRLPGWQRHVKETEAWIRGETVIPEIAHVWPAGPVAAVDVLAPDTATPGKELRFRVVVTNRKVGHNFSTGPLDFIRKWLHVRVLDASGNVVREWGNVDPVTRRIQDRPGTPHEPGNSRSEGTMVLEALPMDEHGEPLRRHELWKKAGGEGQRVIFPGYADNQVYRLTVPADAQGPLEIKADLLFRRYRQEFLDLVVPDVEADRGRQPTVVQTSAARRVAIGKPQ